MEEFTITDADYSIEFTNGQGTLDVDEVSSGDATIVEENDDVHGNQDGEVSIQPDGVGGTGGGDNCVTVDVDQFFASGSFAVG